MLCMVGLFCLALISGTFEKNFLKIWDPLFLSQNLICGKSHDTGFRYVLDAKNCVLAKVIFKSPLEFVGYEVFSCRFEKFE